MTCGSSCGRFLWCFSGRAATEAADSLAAALCFFFSGLQRTVSKAAVVHMPAPNCQIKTLEKLPHQKRPKGGYQRCYQQALVDCLHSEPRAAGIRAWYCPNRTAWQGCHYHWRSQAEPFAATLGTKTDYRHRMASAFRAGSYPAPTKRGGSHAISLVTASPQDHHRNCSQDDPQVAQKGFSPEVKAIGGNAPPEGGTTTA